MTSFIIRDQAERPTPSSWRQDEKCPFCLIIRGELAAYRVFENEKVIAILDILPLRRGHTLVIPKAHYSRLSDLPAEYAAATGEVVSKIANALIHAVENTALNVVCNQEYAQVVQHVHYHIIPAPTIESPSVPSESQGKKGLLKDMHQAEFESRGELDEEEAGVLVHEMRSRL